jgi:hypothetical protein
LLLLLTCISHPLSFWSCLCIFLRVMLEGELLLSKLWLRLSMVL